jgi:hypothetical protein
MFFRRMHSGSVEGIEIRGKRKFLLRTKEALALLKTSSKFEVVCSHIDVIQQGKRSGMKAWLKKPTFVVGGATWQRSALWYAGAIVHDAFHAKLYFDAKRKNGVHEPEADAWTGAQAEKKCLAFQREILVELNADEKTIAYIDECAQNPNYQGRNKGWRSWLDYERRWW